MPLTGKQLRTSISTTSELDLCHTNHPEKHQTHIEQSILVPMDMFLFALTLYSVGKWCLWWSALDFEPTVYYSLIMQELLATNTHTHLYGRCIWNKTKKNAQKRTKPTRTSAHLVLANRLLVVAASRHRSHMTSKRPFEPNYLQYPSGLNLSQPHLAGPPTVMTLQINPNIPDRHFQAYMPQLQRNGSGRHSRNCAVTFLKCNRCRLQITDSVPMDWELFTNVLFITFVVKTTTFVRSVYEWSSSTYISLICQIASEFICLWW